MSVNQYSKADLERIVLLQIENRNALHDLISLLKKQNERLLHTNKKLSEEILSGRSAHYSSRKKK